MPKVLVPLAQGCEEIEAITVIDILRRAGVTVVSAGLDSQPVRASRGVMLIADTTLDAVMNDNSFDMVVLPGGQPGANNLKADQRIIELLQKMAHQGKHVAAICAAPSVLASAGLLEGRKATSFPAALDGFANIDLRSSAVVEDGNLITSRGPGTAMDFALALAGRLVGKTKRQEVEAALQR